MEIVIVSLIGPGSLLDEVVDSALAGFHIGVRFASEVVRRVVVYFAVA